MPTPAVRSGSPGTHKRRCGTQPADQSMITDVHWPRLLPYAASMLPPLNAGDVARQNALTADIRASGADQAVRGAPADSGRKSCRSHVDGVGARQSCHEASRSGGHDDAASRHGRPLRRRRAPGSGRDAWAGASRGDRGRAPGRQDGWGPRRGQATRLRFGGKHAARREAQPGLRRDADARLVPCRLHARRGRHRSARRPRGETPLCSTVPATVFLLSLGPSRAVRSGGGYGVG
jgi:hypothetical protein